MFASVQSVVLVWVVKKVSVIDLYRKDLEMMQALQRTPAGCKLDIRIFATLSEKEDKSDSVSLPIERPRSREELRESSHSPFMQHVMGYGHMLLL